jgi:hypothetical protein
MNSNENITMIFVVLVLVVIPTLLFLLIFYGIRWIIRQLTSEVCTNKAIIVNDRADVVFSQGRDRMNSYNIFLLSFKLENGEIIELALPFREYKKHNINDVGDLTFQGDKFISFTKIED